MKSSLLVRKQATSANMFCLLNSLFLNLAACILKRSIPTRLLEITGRMHEPRSF